jgi:hypothetical protein
MASNYKLPAGVIQLPSGKIAAADNTTRVALRIRPKISTDSITLAVILGSVGSSSTLKMQQRICLKNS